MKKIIAFLVVLFCMIQYGFADTDTLSVADTTFINKKVNEINNKTAASADLIQDSIKSMKKELKDSLQVAAKKKCDCVPDTSESVTGFWKWLLVFMPLLILILAIFLFAKKLSGFKFTEALTENEPPKKIIKNPEYNASAIAANAGIPNLSVLFPATIEISNTENTFSDLKEILAAKNAAVLALQTALNTNTANIPKLNEDVAEAKAKLDAVTATATQAVIDAQTQLDAANSAAIRDQPTIDAAQKTLKDAKQAVADNKEIADAKEKLDTANKALEDNPKIIATLNSLLEKTTEEAKVSQANVDIPGNAASGNNAASVNTYRPSISRYIAFITSMVTIILVVCMSSFFIYHYIRTGCPPEFGALTVVLIALGLGVTPYITNKITTAATVNKS
jgi:hypothetical protein